MAKIKIWHVGFVAGNQIMFSKEMVAEGGPFRKSEAVAIAKCFENNQWRAWVFDDAGRRIFQSAAEIEYRSRINT